MADLPEDLRMLTARDVCALLQIGNTSLHMLRASGRIPQPLKVGGACRWPARCIREWISEGCPPARVFDLQQQGAGRGSRK